MVHTLIHTPHALLREYVLFIGIREFDCTEVLHKPMHAQHEIHIMFMINCKIHDFINAPSNEKKVILKKNSSPDIGFTGVLTSFKGALVFKGKIQLLVIHFKPTGFYRLFGLPPAEFSDCMGDVDELFPRDFLQLHEQLNDARSPSEMFRLTESFLLTKLNKQKTKNFVLEKATNFMMSQPEIYSVEELAYHSNMSLKTFERKFVQEVGIFPKLFSRIQRFNKAIDLKTYKPTLTWLDICYQAGYYDPMHMVKDFKKFAGMSPTNLFRNAPPLYEDISLDKS